MGVLIIQHTQGSIPDVAEVISPLGQILDVVVLPLGQLFAMFIFPFEKLIVIAIIALGEFLVSLAFPVGQFLVTVKWSTSPWKSSFSGLSYLKQLWFY